MSWANYHSHTHYCDGKGFPEQYVQAALARNFFAYGFSSHCPFEGGAAWNMDVDRFMSYQQEIRRLKQQYSGEIELYLGLEMDFIPGVISNHSAHVATAGLDFTIGSIHYTGTFTDGIHCEVDGPHQVFLRGVNEIFDGDVQAMVKRYFALTREMALTSPPDVVGHLDKIKMQSEEGVLFDEYSPWYQDEIALTLEVIARQKLRVEVNIRGIYKKKVLETYPSHWILREMCAMGIPIVLSSDNHLPEEMDLLFPETARLLQEIGFQSVDVLYKGKWQPVGLHEDGLVIPEP